MTAREKQILEWIKADPTISQERLAGLAGITRSAVAVHISNLTKKGYLAGKGYVIRGGEYVAVVGGVNIDIGGRAYAPLAAKDSNPGKITVAPGGVGRNIAQVLRLLDVEVNFFTALGDDIYTRRITDSCEEAGIDISRALRVAGGSTPTYIYLNDPNGELAVALSDMELCERIDPSYLAANLPALNNARAVIVDANLPEESLAFIADHCSAPIFADPVSTKKAVKLKPLLGKIHTLKPNRIEAETLSGVEITDRESLARAAEKLLGTGLERVFISLGKEGVCAANREGVYFCPCFEAKVKNTAGAGDAFTAALAAAFLRGKDLASSCRFAAAAAALNTECAETVNPLISVEAIERMIK